MTLFSLINRLAWLGNERGARRPVYDVADSVVVTLVKAEPDSVLVRLSGHASLGRVLQSPPGAS